MGEQGGLVLRRRVSALGFEVAIEPPDQMAYPLLCRAVLVGESVEFVNETLGMHPAQGMAADLELAGIIADDDGVVEEAMRRDAAPERAFGGDLHRIGVDLERRDADPSEMRQPRCPVGKALAVVLA